VSVAIGGPVVDGLVIDIRTDPKNATSTLYRAIISAEGLRELGEQIDVLLRRYDAAHPARSKTLSGSGTPEALLTRRRTPGGLFPVSPARAP
jgi:hypothetical protein